MSSEELPGGRAVEEQGMKITVFGGLLIVAAVVAVAALIEYLLNDYGANPNSPKRISGNRGGARV